MLLENVTNDHLGFGKDIGFIFRGLQLFWILGYSCEVLVAAHFITPHVKNSFKFS